MFELRRSKIVKLTLTEHVRDIRHNNCQKVLFHALYVLTFTLCNVRNLVLKTFLRVVCSIEIGWFPFKAKHSQLKY